jgi:hypothetical protein
LWKKFEGNNNRILFQEETREFGSFVLPDSHNFKAEKVNEIVTNTFNRWVREVINPQARAGNNISLDDFTRDGMKEYLYPVSFVVDEIEFQWSYGSRKTKGRGMSSHNELWLHADAWGLHERIATGDWTLSKTRKWLKLIYNRIHGSPN